MKEDTDQRIEKILAFYFGEMGEDEKRELEAWVNESKENKAEFQRIVRVCQRLRLTLAEEQAVRMEEHLLERYRQMDQNRRRQRILRFVSYAAVLILCLGIGWVYYLRLASSDSEVLKSVYLLEAKPGEKVALLRLDSGKEWVLNEQQKQKLEIDENAVLKGDSIFLKEESPAGRTTDEEEYYTLVVPKGGEYNLTLADGTHVWLNSDTELKFPSGFKKNVREVYLKGEAFFEVTSDSLHPFVVRTGEANIRVLGTSFNVMNYMDEQQVEVALQHGKVEFTATQTQQVYPLTPGKMISLNKENAEVVLTEKDTDLIGIWRTGFFYFEDMSMEELVMKLERWYQVKFVFASEEVKQLRFTGAIKKYRELSYALNIIAKTKDIECMDFGDEIRIYQK